MKDGTADRQAAHRQAHRRRHRDAARREGLRQERHGARRFVLFHVAFDEQKDISTYSSAPTYGGYGWGWGGGWGTTTTDVRVREILVGTLAIDIVDARKGESPGAVSARRRSTPTRSPKSATRTSPRRWKDLQELPAEGEQLTGPGAAAALVLAVATVGRSAAGRGAAPETFRATASVKKGTTSASAP